VAGGWKQSPEGLGIARATCSALTFRVALAAALLAGAAAPVSAGEMPVLPSGGSFAAGSGGIAGSGSTLNVTQTSLRGIIDWSGFSIGVGGLVQFNNGAGATLNRVTGAEESEILGRLSATGGVYLLNPNGVLIGKSGVIVTGGSFVAATLDTPDNAFLAGGALTLSGSSIAAVENQGTVSSMNGNVFLVARTVTNGGGIAALNGMAGLAAGQEVLLQDSTSDPRIFVEAPGGEVTNSGMIAAAAVALRRAGGNVYALAGNNGGMISATGTQTINGHVWLTASNGGSVPVAGLAAGP
jgi:mucin-19